MKKTSPLILTKLTLLALLALLVAAPLLAQCGAPTQAAPPAAMEAAKSGFRADFLKQWDTLETKFVGLAEAIPQEKYTWRPTPEVRSVSEVFLHVALGNYSYLDAIGVPLPAGMDRKTYEKSTTDRAKIVEQLKLSFGLVRETVLKTSDADLEKPAKLYGQPSTVREVLFALVTHTPEHLGQMIVYGRECGVVPPWTAERQARQKQQQPPPKKSEP
ncbi:MAG TPA: DinB family protein [Terriglobales bacterium]|nr:DinB family protein [Terriglobales bacterium]